MHERLSRDVSVPVTPGRCELWTWHNSDPDTNRKGECFMMAIKSQALNAAAECYLWSHKNGLIPERFRGRFFFGIVP